MTAGPFLVAEPTELAESQEGYAAGWVTRCFKCRQRVLVPRDLMVDWRNSGAVAVCPTCSGGQVGQILETF